MTKKNKIEDLRNHLFETLEALRNEAHPMDLARAREIANVGKVIVASAKAEVDFLRVTGSLPATDFFPIEEDEGFKRKAIPERN